MTQTQWLDLRKGDCRILLREHSANSFDAVVTDPPYGLGFMGKGWDKREDNIAFDKDFWAEVWRVLKPGAHLLAFSGTRTYHRMVCAIEDAGFEIRDQIVWLYGSGFPKSKNVAMSINKEAGIIKHRDVGAYTAPEGTPGYAWNGWGTALKPAQEPIVLARKPLACSTIAENVQCYGTGGLNIDASRIAAGKCLGHANAGQSTSGETFHAAESEKIVGRWPANVMLDAMAAVMLDAATGFLPSGTVVRRNGPSPCASTRPRVYSLYAKPQAPDLPPYDAGGGASRFFYTAKAHKTEREAGCKGLEELTSAEQTDRVEGGRKNHHPTVKPVSLMLYLIRLITPPGGSVLDPFMGSGTTGVAAIRGAYSFAGCEREAAFYAIAEARIQHAEWLRNTSE